VALPGHERKPMLRISKKADYAVFLLGCIAREGAYPGGSAAEAVVSAQEIARQASLNKSMVANLLKEFARHGVLESVRGLKGGYRLVRAPHELSLGQILEVIEGPFMLVECIRESAGSTPSSLLPVAPGVAPGVHDHNCSLISFCPSKNPMRVVHDRIHQLFRQIKLDELCGLAAHQRAAATATVGAHR